MLPIDLHGVFLCDIHMAEDLAEDNVHMIHPYGRIDNRHMTVGINMAAVDIHIWKKTAMIRHVTLWQLIERTPIYGRRLPAIGLPWIILNI